MGGGASPSSSQQTPPLTDISNMHINTPAPVMPPPKRARAEKVPGETRIQRYAREILVYMDGKETKEGIIRITFGNSPDTSKALRLCVPALE
jgi:hypothetical protein